MKGEDTPLYKTCSGLFTRTRSIIEEECSVKWVGSSIVCVRLYEDAR